MPPNKNAGLIKTGLEPPLPCWCLNGCGCSSDGLCCLVAVIGRVKQQEALLRGREEEETVEASSHLKQD